MKPIRIILTVIIALLLAIPEIQSSGKKIYILDGYFFYEIPVDNKLVNGIIPIKTASGTKAVGLSISTPLAQEAIQYAIPPDQIPESDILLEMYKEKQNRMIRLSVVSEELIKVGDIFPNFKAVDINGKEWTNVDVKNKVMVLNCWFTGCGPCRAEMPELSEWKNEMPDVMFFSSTYESPETAGPILEDTGFNWIALVNDTQFKDLIGRNGYPMTIVVDKKGKVAQIEYGTSLIQRKKLKETINSLR